MEALQAAIFVAPERDVVGLRLLRPRSGVTKDFQ